MPGAYYVMDRGYLDFGRLYQLHQAKAYFVTRAGASHLRLRRESRQAIRLLNQRLGSSVRVG